MRWIQEHTLQAITLVGLLFYGGALLTYSNFYAEFGVTPEDAGVDYTSALARTIPAFVSWVVVVAVVAAVFVVSLGLALVVPVALLRRRKADLGDTTQKNETRATAAAPAISERQAEPPGPTEKAESGRRKNLPPPERDDQSIYAVVLAVFVAVLFLSEAADKADDLAQRVKDGQEVTPTRLFADPLETRFAFWKNPLRIRVEHVRVFPATPGARMPAGLTPRSTWALLGRSADVIVLHDVRSDREVTIRVPADRIVIKDVGVGVTPARRHDRTPSSG